LYAVTQIFTHSQIMHYALLFLTSITYALSKTRCHSLSSFPSQNCIRSFTIPCPQLYGIPVEWFLVTLGLVSITLSKPLVA